MVKLLVFPLLFSLVNPRAGNREALFGRTRLARGVKFLSTFADIYIWEKWYDNKIFGFRHLTYLCCPTCASLSSLIDQPNV